MRITVTDDTGEVFATLRDVGLSREGRWYGTDDDGAEGVTVESVLNEAAQWEVNR